MHDNLLNRYFSRSHKRTETLGLCIGHIPHCSDRAFKTCELQTKLKHSKVYVSCVNDDILSTRFVDAEFRDCLLKPAAMKEYDAIIGKKTLKKTPCNIYGIVCACEYYRINIVLSVLDHHVRVKLIILYCSLGIAVIETISTTSPSPSSPNANS